MITRPLLALGIYAAAVAETAIVEQPHMLQVCWLVLVASFAMWRLPRMEAAIWAAVIGLINDALGAGPFGLSIISLGTVVWLSTYCRERWMGDSLASYGVLTMLGAALFLLTIAGGRVATGEQFGTPQAVAMVIAGAAAATGLTGMLIVIAWRTIFYALAANGLTFRLPARPGAAEISRPIN